MIHVATGLVALMAMSAFVVDYGVLWVSRRQAQTAADAAALSGAISYSMVEPGNQTLAQNAAVQTALLNRVWDAVPDITTADVTFPTCPPGSPGVADTCVRANTFRNTRSGGNPLPMFFGRLVGLNQQGVRATAVAQLLVSASSDCVKPWAIPDKWIELNPVPSAWDFDDSFERYVQNGQNRGQVLVPADSYTPPSANADGTGFTIANDYGTLIVLKSQSPGGALIPGWYQPVVINPIEGPGGNNYENNIATCDPTVIGPGTVLTTEPGNMVGPTNHGVEDLIALDPTATWDSTANGGEGAPTGGCMAAGTCSRSPRLVAIPVFNPDIWDNPTYGNNSGRGTIVVVKVIGMWIEGFNADGDVFGYISHIPGVSNGNTSITPNASFARQVILVR